MNEKLTELFKIMADNPGMDVLFRINNEEISYEFAWSIQRIQRIEINWFYELHENFYIGMANIEEEFENYYDDSTGEARERFDQLVESGEITKKICVFMGA